MPGRLTGPVVPFLFVRRPSGYTERDGKVSDLDYEYICVVPDRFARQSRDANLSVARIVLLLDFFYLFVLILLSPWLLVMLVSKPAFRAGIRERFILPRGDGSLENTVWLHGSSAGEIDLLRPLVRKIEEDLPDSCVVVSAFTISGYAFARKAFPNHRIIYFPADFSLIIRGFFRVLKPVLIVIVESEFWPNFIATAEMAGIPVCVLNARMSAKSHRVHSMTRLVPWALRKVSLFAIQSEDHAARFRDLGVPEVAIHVTGNMKYDLSDKTDASGDRRKLRKQYGISDDIPVWIGGSVHSGEDEALAWAHSQLVGNGYRVQLVIVPRYPSEAAAVAQVLKKHGLAAVCKSEFMNGEGPVLSDPRDVLIVDTIGDLKRYYSMSDIAYVGGSLHFRGSNKGGHNLMEPAILGVAPIFGPYNFSFQETVRALQQDAAGVLVHNREEIYASLGDFIEHPESAKAMGARARQVILNNRGATELNFALIETCIANR